MGCGGGVNPGVIAGRSSTGGGGGGGGGEGGGRATGGGGALMTAGGAGADETYWQKFFMVSAQVHFTLFFYDGQRRWR
jgi:hypothetical protein